MRGLGEVVDLARRHRFDVALVAVLVVLELAGFGQDPGIGVASTALELVPILALLVRRVAAPVVAVAYLLANVIAAVTDLHAINSGPIIATIVIGTYSAGAYLPLRWGLVTLAVWFAALGVDFLEGHEDGGAGDLAFAGMVLVISFAPGVVARRLREQVVEADRVAREAVAHETARTAEALADERARIARELHDVVAHAVSIMVVQAAAAEELLERDPDRARAALAAVQEGGRAAVRELARMLDLLRGTPADGLAPLPTVDGLPTLVEEARLAGADVSLDTDDVGPLPPALSLCAFRVVQEALTNATKHAREPHVTVVLSRSDGHLDVRVEDDGGAGPRTVAGTGHGLLGLRERVEVFDGTLEAGPRPGGGFRVHALLPIGGAP